MAQGQQPHGIPPHAQPPHGFHPGQQQQQQQHPQQAHSPAQAQAQAHAAAAQAQALRKRHATDNLLVESMRSGGGVGGPAGIKRGKPTSRAIPPSVQRHVPESALYGQLQKDEKALDWTLARKRAELTDGMSSRPPKVKRTLRVFLSNTCANQPWQKEAANADSASASTSDGIPSWTLRIEGRLLEPNFRSRATNAKASQATSDRIGAQKFSNLIKTCVVELQRDAAAYPPEENLVEWHRPTPTAAPQGRAPGAGSVTGPSGEGHENPLISAADPGLDGFEIKRKGSEAVKVKIAMYLSYNPERFSVSPELGSLLDLKEETRQGVISALWGYIKDRKLLDERDRRVVRCDAPLASILKADAIGFHHIPEVINRHLHPLRPVVLEYWVRTDVDVNKHSTAFDIELELDDWSVRAKQDRVLSLFDSSNDRSREIAELDEKISQGVSALQNHSSARDFLYNFSQDPLNHLKTWLASQSRDLDSILGVSSSVPGSGVNSGLSNEDLRRAETFTGTWLEEAILGHVAIDTAKRQDELDKWNRQQQAAANSGQ
ncbi:unnamed protein product [Sympodiomycopsis kandeliae]